jgi:hypothetical protein
LLIEDSFVLRQEQASGTLALQIANEEKDRSRTNAKSDSQFEIQNCQPVEIDLSRENMV